MRSAILTLDMELDDGELIVIQRAERQSLPSFSTKLETLQACLTGVAKMREAFAIIKSMHTQISDLNEAESSSYVVDR